MRLRSLHQILINTARAGFPLPAQSPPRRAAPAAHNMACCSPSARSVLKSITRNPRRFRTRDRHSPRAAVRPARWWSAFPGGARRAPRRGELRPADCDSAPSGQPSARTRLHRQGADDARVDGDDPVDGRLTASSGTAASDACTRVPNRGPDGRPRTSGAKRSRPGAWHLAVAALAYSAAISPTPSPSEHSSMAGPHASCLGPGIPPLDISRLALGDDLEPNVLRDQLLATQAERRFGAELQRRRIPPDDLECLVRLKDNRERADVRLKWCGIPERRSATLRRPRPAASTRSPS